MINNVLDAYRLDAGGEQFQITRVDLDSLIAECLQDLEPIAQGKSIELRMSSTCKHKAYADNMAMRRVIINLVSNALKFTPAGGSVQVSCEQIGGAISLKVKDDGIGIAPEKLPNLFERFYQTDTQNRASGLGLGLHLCQHLMIAQKGTISCTSKPGEGSTFEVTLPIAYEESVKALIVDDNAANRMTLQRMLKRLSVESVAVSNGLEAIAAATTHSFEAVFMDIQMPGMDGFNTSKAMREAGVSAPIVAYTGFGDGTLQKFSEAGMSDVLEKPAALARVKEVIEQYIPQPWSPR
jgi:CheY-like chemotaxis protein